MFEHPLKPGDPLDYFEQYGNKHSITAVNTYCLHFGHSCRITCNVCNIWFNLNVHIGKLLKPIYGHICTMVNHDELVLWPT